MNHRTTLVALLISAGLACNRQTTTAPPAAAPVPKPAAPKYGEPIPAPADVAAPPATAQHGTNGLAYEVITKGTGTDHPALQDMVEVHFVGWGTDGVMFDSSVAPARSEFAIETAMPAWHEALLTMVPGEKRRLWVPPALAYGEHPGGNVPHGTLVFDLELIGIMHRPAGLPAPEDVAKAPTSAKKTRSGIVYRVITPAKSPKHPRPADVIELHYTGWSSPDGKMVETTTRNAHPASMRTDSLGKAWTEALRLMGPGETARFWMPARLIGYGGPAETVVYDVQLLGIK